MLDVLADVRLRQSPRLHEVGKGAVGNAGLKLQLVHSVDGVPISLGESPLAVPRLVVQHLLNGAFELFRIPICSVRLRGGFRRRQLGRGKCLLLLSHLYEFTDDGAVEGSGGCRIRLPTFL